MLTQRASLLERGEGPRVVCGINGILRLDPGSPPVDRVELLRTRDAMAPRGPDGAGAWTDAGRDIGLGHRRLAIIDLTDAGLQPMARADGRFRLVFNGEIYNYRELRDGLIARGERFDSRSDSEVILALYAREGIAMLPKLRGMFALAIWDAVERSLLLARDPYGIKPLYYAASRGALRFASQVKALEVGGGVEMDVDPAAVAGFLLWGSVPQPLTLRRAIRAVPAGHYVVAKEGRVGDPVRYHRFAAPSGPAAAATADPTAALEESVRLHLESDVPVAVFLSAGLDSSLIAALVARATGRPPTTLTLRFDRFEGTARDEGPFAAEIAKSLGARHLERWVRRDDFLDLWPSAVGAMDQPSIDGFNTFVVSRVAHEAGFKVVLSGLGGDEVFGSYDTFADLPRWRRAAGAVSWIPGAAFAWKLAARAIAKNRPKLPGLVELGGTQPGAYFVRRGLHLPEEVARLVGARTTREVLQGYDPVADAASRLEQECDADRSDWFAAHVLESTMYMRNQLLRDVDWASMAHSLELRVPLVDVRLQQALAAASFEPARTLGKAAAVRRAAPELPAALWSRPKTGFGIPVIEWLDEELGFRGTAGQGSRRLALRILNAFGVALDKTPERDIDATPMPAEA